MSIQWPDESIFEPFAILEETYKFVDGQEIKAAILIPRSLPEGSYPVILNIHGGFWMTGHSLFAPFFPKFVVALALQRSAIIISPDYRLLPTKNGMLDIMEDLDDFWSWSRSQLPAVLERAVPGYALDFSRLLVSGGSAGGYCAAQIALSHPDEVSAVAMLYPALDMKDRHWYDGPSKVEPTILRLPEADMPGKDETAAWIAEKRRSTVSKAGFERTPYCAAAAQHGLFMSTVMDPKGIDVSIMFPLERITSGARLPKAVWLMHGDDDATVPIRGSQKFVNLVKQDLPDTAIRYDVVEGCDHAFDVDESTWTPIATSAMDFVGEAWLTSPGVQRRAE